MITFKCKMCGGDLSFEPGATVSECPYCGTTQTLPKLDDDRRTNLYDRANHFRRQNEYDKAMAIYEQILAEDRTDAEAYWSLVLCRYGIEYVEDPASHKLVPTVNRAQYASILADEDYKSALTYADALQKGVYEAEANAIAEIQKGILDISKKEEPFDVFICYKETDANGRRTPDSVLANEIYHQLTREGLKVFFAKITLEDKIGEAYEPYIFAALNSANVMVVLGTKPAHFQAVWVKNEWSRYLALIRAGQDKTLIPAYRDMDPYDLPEEFSHLQALDMSQIGFMPDLVRGIRKLTAKGEQKTQPAVQQTVIQQSAQAEPLLRRAFIFLEDGDWAKADDFCEKVLNSEPENARAYLGKLMAQLKVKKEEQLKYQPQPFDDNGHYQKIVRFGDAALKEKLEADNKFIRERNEHARQKGIFDDASKKLAAAKTPDACREARNIFESISQFDGASEKIKACDEQEMQCRQAQVKAQRKAKQKRAIITVVCVLMALIIAGCIYYNLVIVPKQKYDSAVALRRIGKYEEAIAAFNELGKYSDAAEQISATFYTQGEALRDAGDYDGAVEAFTNAGEYSDAAGQVSETYYAQGEGLRGAGDYDGAVKAFTNAGEYGDAAEQVSATYYAQGEALHESGDCINAALAFGKAGSHNDAREQAFALWNDIADRQTVSAGDWHTVGLKTDGTVTTVGSNGSGQCDVSGWTDIVAVATSNWLTVGLKADGMVIAVGDNDHGRCDIADWTNIVAVSAGRNHTVGLKTDGTVAATDYKGWWYVGQCDVSDWTDIVAVAAGHFHTVGLKSDGRVVAVGSNAEGQCEVFDWINIVEVAAGYEHTVGLKADGTVTAVGSNGSGQCDVSGWTDIVAVAAGEKHTVGLKADGTVVAVGKNKSGQCDISGWTDIVAVAAGDEYTVGLKADGTAIAVGYNSHGQCDVSDWTDIKLPTHQVR